MFLRANAMLKEAPRYACFLLLMPFPFIPFLGDIVAAGLGIGKDFLLYMSLRIETLLDDGKLNRTSEYGINMGVIATAFFISKAEIYNALEAQQDFFDFVMSEAFRVWAVDSE